MADGGGLVGERNVGDERSGAGFIEQGEADTVHRTGVEKGIVADVEFPRSLG